MKNLAYKMPKIKELVFNGGGARGSGMHGVYDALIEAGIWNDIEIIAGTSVGSISAVFFSVSPNHKTLHEKIKGLHEALDMKYQFFPLGLSLDPLVDYLNQYLREHILFFLNELNFDQENESILYLKDLKKILDDNDDYEITFNDIHYLHQCAPNQFKNVFITATYAHEKDFRLAVFDYQNTPNQSIAKSCQASSALPKIFQPVYLNGQVYFDGGFAAPLPTDVTDNDENSSKLIFAFGPGPVEILGPVWQNSIHGKPNPELFFLKGFYFNDLSESYKIQIFIDKNNKKVFYQLPFQKQVQSLSFNELGMTSMKLKSLNLSKAKRLFKHLLPYFNRYLLKQAHQIDEEYDVLTSMPENLQSTNRMQIIVHPTYLAYRLAHQTDFQEVSFAELEIHNDYMNMIEFENYQSKFFSLLAHQQQLPFILGTNTWVQLVNYVVSLFLNLVSGAYWLVMSMYEHLAHTLREHFSFHTVLLNTKLSPIDFKKGEATAEEERTNFYLTTMNHLVNYQFINESYDNFFESLMDDFYHYYCLWLELKNLSQQKDPWVIKYLKAYEGQDQMYHKRDFFYELHQDLIQNITSIRAKILSAVVQKHLQINGMTDDKLKMLICEQTNNRYYSSFKLFFNDQPQTNRQDVNYAPSR